MIFFSQRLNNKGFTLMESVAGVLCIGIASASVLGAFIVGKYTLERSTHRSQVMTMITAQMENIISQCESGYTNVLPGSTTTNEIINTRGNNDPEDDVIGSKTVTVTQITAGIYGYKQVDVTINWTENGWGGSTAMSVTATTYVTQK